MGSAVAECLAKKLLEVNSVDIAYNLEINEFRGNQNLQLKVKDIQSI
jgi:hypothetical protein